MKYNITIYIDDEWPIEETHNESSYSNYQTIEERVVEIGTEGIIRQNGGEVIYYPPHRIKNIRIRKVIDETNNSIQT